MSIVTQLTTSKDRIEFLLKNYPSLRDDDKKLWISYLVMFHGLQDILMMPQPFDALCNLLLTQDVVKAESIRRVRQKLQEQGSYKKNKKVELQKNAYNVKNRVEHLLKNYSALRDNDTQLWLAYLTMFHGLKDKINEAVNAYEEFCNILLDDAVPAIETVRRTRQGIQEQGLYEGVKRKQRLREAKRVSAWARS